MKLDRVAIKEFPLSVSKIMPPRLPAILPRPRLVERIKQHRDKKLIFILGSAAQGKTTLAAAYVQQSPLASAWLNLGPEDSKAVNLFYLLVQSLQRALPESDLAPLLSYPSLATGPREEIPLYRDWLVVLLSQVQSPVQVVFDGLDRLAPQASAYRFLQVLLEVAPPHLFLLMLSREMPPLKLQELKMRQEVHLILNQDLAFTARETRNFLQSVRRLILPYELMVQLHEVTEGWIGGLVLLSELLERLPEMAREKFLYQDFSDKFMEEVSGYFNEIIFSTRSPAVQEFLIKSSILDVVDPEFVEDHLGTDQARAILEDLSGKNLFVQPVFDKQRGWLYRYHQLFRDFLQAKFRESLSVEQRASVYLQAGSRLEERGDAAGAVDFYLKAGAWERAAAAIEQVAPQYLKQAKTAELADWLQSLPPALMQARPWLLLYHFLAGRFSGGPEYFLSLQQAHSLFQTQGDLRGLLLTAAHFLEVGTFASHPAFPMAVLLSRAEELLQEADIRAFPYETAVLWFQVGLAKMLYSSDIRQGYQACRRAYFLAKEAGERHLESQALLFSYTILALQGDFHAAQKAYREAEAGLADCTSPDLQVLHLLGAGILRGFQGEVDQYEILVKEAQALVEQHGLIALFPLIMIHRLNSLGYAGKYAAALETSLHALNVPSFPIVLKGVVAEQLAIFYYHIGDLAAARQHIAQAREILLNEASKCNYHFPVLKMAESVFSYHLGEQLDAAADQDLQDILQEADAISSYLFLVDIHWIIAFWRWRQGRLREAADHIKAGMNIASRRGSYFSLLFSSRDRARIFTLALELGVEEVWDRLTPLLVDLAEWTEPDLERLSRQANPKIAAKARKIRVAIHRARVPRLRLQTIGGFQLWRGDSLLDEVGREGQKAILLLKALIAHGARAVPKEVLMEDLWPETFQETAENNFKVFLHRLRKILEPDLGKTFGSVYLHLKGKLLSLDPELCRLDVDEFLSLARQGEEREHQGQDQAALAFYKQALEVYRGDFLAEELYQPWAAGRREELRSLHLDLMFQVAALHERRGAVRLATNTYQQVIRTDPLAEEAYQKLMLLYARRGKRNAALRLYEELRQILHRELQTEPEKGSQAIYKKILESP